MTIDETKIDPAKYYRVKLSKPVTRGTFVLKRRDDHVVRGDVLIEIADSVISYEDA